MELIMDTDRFREKTYHKSAAEIRKMNTPENRAENFPEYTSLKNVKAGNAKALPEDNKVHKPDVKEKKNEISEKKDEQALKKTDLKKNESSMEMKELNL